MNMCKVLRTRPSTHGCCMCKPHADSLLLVKVCRVEGIAGRGSHAPKVGPRGQALLLKQVPEAWEHRMAKARVLSRSLLGSISPTRVF